jgi:hypothetical protein
MKIVACVAFVSETRMFLGKYQAFGNLFTLGDY